MLHHCSHYSFCQNYHQCDGLLCLRLVWTYNRNITLHFTYLRMQQVLERKRQAKKKKKRVGKGEADGVSGTSRKKEGSSFHATEVFTCHTEEALHVPAPSGRRVGPCVARKATRTMQLGLVVLAMIFLSSMGHSDALKLSKARRQRRVSPEMPLSCPKGCDRCSEYNGCIKCKPKLFIFLERNDIRQIGVCLASCPMGYFGMRNPEGNNRCTQCKIENCEACFNRNFCTKCKEGLYSHSGRCYVSCPPDQSAINETMECVGQRISECELGEWSQWTSCMKKNKTCGFRKGSQSRSRVPLSPVQSPDTSLAVAPSQTCAPETEKRKCTVTKKAPCGREQSGKSDRQDDTKRRGRENGRGRGRDKGSSRGGGGGGRRRKGQSRTTTAPSITTSSVS